jgi:hypothetical protein
LRSAGRSLKLDCQSHVLTCHLKPTSFSGRGRANQQVELHEKIDCHLPHSCDSCLSASCSSTPNAPNSMQSTWSALNGGSLREGPTYQGAVLSKSVLSLVELCFLSLSWFSSHFLHFSFFAVQQSQLVPTSTLEIPHPHCPFGTLLRTVVTTSHKNNNNKQTISHSSQISRSDCGLESLEFGGLLKGRKLSRHSFIRALLWFHDGQRQSDPIQSHRGHRLRFRICDRSLSGARRLEGIVGEPSHVSLCTSRPGLSSTDS